MGNILAFCEFDGGALRASALSNLTFARQAATAHGGEVIALLIGVGAAAAGAAAAGYAAKVITVEHSGFLVVQISICIIDFKVFKELLVSTNDLSIFS